MSKNQMVGNLGLHGNPFTDNNAGLQELYFVPQEEESEFINLSARPQMYSHGHLM